MNSMQDKTLVCSDCGQEFTFSASEQEFFTQKGFSQPSRCRLCRAARKAARGGGSSSYGESSGGGYSGSGYSGGGGYSSGERQMYPAVCAQCGKDTQVPFQPRGDRPVYCSDCYRAQQGSGGGSSYGGGSGGRRRY